LAEKVKKPFYKKWWVWLLGVIIIAAAASGGGEETEQASTEPKEETKAEQPKKEEPKKEEPKKEEKSFGIGQEVKVGDMVYKVNGKTAADQVGPSALPEKASGKFIVIDVTLKNNGNEAVTVDASFFKLKRGEKTYEADSAASMSANQGEDGSIENSFFLQELNPDSEITGKVVFDVAPEVAQAADLQLQVQTGVFGTETEVINLQ
jgi:Domain of unknown function (DUF4352)